MLAIVAVLDELRELVDKDGRARRQIALAAGIHPNTFTSFMTGGRELGLESAEKLADALGYTLSPTLKKKK